MPVREASAVWNGGLKSGSGTMRIGSGGFKGSYGFGTRFEESPGSNPEELIGAALAGCFSMALSADVERAGHSPGSVETTAKVHLVKGEGGWGIESVELATVGRVSDMDDDTFRRLANEASRNCPVARALAVPVRVDARLAG